MEPSAVSVRGLTKRHGARTVVALRLGLVKRTAGSGTVLGAPLDVPTADNLRLIATVGGHDPSPVSSVLDQVGLAARAGLTPLLVSRRM